ncbi:MAG TPA: hypothetical protein VEC18_11435 [Myxococcota bacterium]|nr:hypothetical protein [Myxococcota bacterium]
MRSELLEAPPADAKRLANEIARRHGRAVAAVLFYGSCLRRRTSEGVLDFYALVDRYRDAYHSRALAWANAALPPNVFYLEVASGAEPLRAKYAVVSLRDFERGARPGGIRSGIWARFCQPALAVYLRDDAAREAVVAAVAQCSVTAVSAALAEPPLRARTLRFSSADLWRRVLGNTYAAELRPESPEAIQRVFEATPERYDRIARAVLASLGGEVRGEPGSIEAVMPADWEPPRSRFARLRRAAAKLVYALQLLKSAATFGDWLPYVLWKLERHTGTKIVPSERQRRFPFLFGWPLLVKVLWQRDLR